MIGSLQELGKSWSGTFTASSASRMSDMETKAKPGGRRAIQTSVTWGEGCVLEDLRGRGIVLFHATSVLSRLLFFWPFLSEVISEFSCRHMA